MNTAVQIRQFDKQTEFVNLLTNENCAKATVGAYMFALRDFYGKYKVCNKKNLLLYKMYLIETFKPKTVNLRIVALNKYLDFIKKPKLKLKAVKVQSKAFIDNIISFPDYEFLRDSLKADGDMQTYFMVRLLAATGARVSEFVNLKIEHLRVGYFDIYSKGGKIRRLYIPMKLCEECLSWLEGVDRESGYVFISHLRGAYTTRGVANRLKLAAKKYGIDEKVCYPHSFRHMFAKKFLERYNDISLLADLMGHESIETTRIYLRKTSTEQQAIVDKVITW